MSDDRTLDLPFLEVETTPESQRFWAELGRGKVVVSWCTVCDTHVWPSAARCRTCMNLVTEERTLTGRGSLYSYTVVHRGAPAMKRAVPYVLAYVTLEGGPTVMANVVESDREQLTIGAEVELVTPPDHTDAGAFRFRVRR